MRAPALALFVVLSAAPLALEAFGLLEVRASPRLGLALIPWLALAGLPARAPRPRAARAEAAALFALPVLLVAAAADARAAGASLFALDQVKALGGGVAAIALLAAAAERGERIHAALWLALVAGPPALAAAFRASADGLGAGEPAFLKALLSASPLLWAADLVTGAKPATLLMLAVTSAIAAAAIAEGRVARSAQPLARGTGV